MVWVCLFVAGLLEVAWAYFMKRSDGFTLLGPSLLALVLMIASLGFLAVSMRSLPLGTAYAIWTGIGAAGAFVAGIVLAGEAVTPMRLFAVGFILLGMVLMKLSHAS